MFDGVDHSLIPSSRTFKAANRIRRIEVSKIYLSIVIRSTGSAMLCYAMLCYNVVMLVAFMINEVTQSQIPHRKYFGL